jgi:hypothetical protein
VLVLVSMPVLVLVRSEGGRQCGCGNPEQPDREAGGELTIEAAEPFFLFFAFDFLCSPRGGETQQHLEGEREELKVGGMCARLSIIAGRREEARGTTTEETRRRGELTAIRRIESSE